MSKPVSHALIAAGINPRVLFSALDGCINDIMDEQTRLSEKFGVERTHKQQRLDDQLFKLHEVLDVENEIHTTHQGKLKTELN